MLSKVKIYTHTHFLSNSLHQIDNFAAGKMPSSLHPLITDFTQGVYSYGLPLSSIHFSLSYAFFIQPILIREMM